MGVLKFTGRLVDMDRKEIYPASVFVVNGRIDSIEKLNAGEGTELPWILPGLIDAHVHIESSMLVPSQFARLAVVHGTVATVSDPHEIANVCGLEGVDFMIADGMRVPFKFYFGAPSCVPATLFETAGASLKAGDIEKLLQRKEIRYLSEMMNFPGVLHGDPEVMAKLKAAWRLKKPVDGHAPGLRGEMAKQYIEAGRADVDGVRVGISTDHECFTREEALDKLHYGMKVIIREGSAAKNFEALIDLLNEYPDSIMFCSDDKHPDSLLAGHINQLCARALAKGINLFKVLKAACVNPVLHYGLDVGMLRVKDPADFIIVDKLEDFRVIKTYIDGILVAEKGVSLIENGPQVTASVQALKNQPPLNNFNAARKSQRDFEYAIGLSGKALFPDAKVEVPAMEALDGQLITNKLSVSIPVRNNKLLSDIRQDILKIVVVNRYREAPAAKAFIKNFGLKRGAIASSVAHDSHNIVAVGVDDESICRAINLIIDHRGGVSCVGKIGNVASGTGEELEMILPLPVAGLMSMEDGYQVAEAYAAIDQAAKDLGSQLSSPYMTLSFMALLVIPHLKLSDLGLFDGDSFSLL
jgi:adenine deaminase